MEEDKKLCEWTPEDTADYLMTELSPKLERYAGKVCLFWDESTHYYGCMGGNDDGIIGLIREIRLVKGEDDVSIAVVLKTCDKEWTIGVDQFHIDLAEDLMLVEDAEEIDFSVDENGYFKDIEIEPLFGYFYLGEAADYSLNEYIGDSLEWMLRKNFLGRKCYVKLVDDRMGSLYDDDDDEEDSPVVIEEIEAEYDIENGVPWIKINGDSGKYDEISIFAVDSEQ